MSKKNRKKYRSAKLALEKKVISPDDYFSYGSIEMARFGKVNILRSHMSQEEFEIMSSKLAERVPLGQKVRRRVTPAIRKELLTRSGYKCQIMDCPFCENVTLTHRQSHIDHLVAFSICRDSHVEPDVNPENLRVLCAKMNRWKSDQAQMSLNLPRPLPPPLMSSQEGKCLKRERR